MSATKTRMPLAEAERLAAEVTELLRPRCERIEVAGSIRRRKAEVGDLEIVCAPSLIERRDLFGDVSLPPISLLDELCDALFDAGTFDVRLDKNGRRAWGSRYKRLLYRGVALDLFSVIEPAQFGVLYVLRTGSADFSHRLVAPKPYGWMPSGLRVQDGAIWRNGEIVPTPEETDVFALIGREWVPPERREV